MSPKMAPDRTAVPGKPGIRTRDSIPVTSAFRPIGRFHRRVCRFAGASCATQSSLIRRMSSAPDSHTTDITPRARKTPKRQVVGEDAPVDTGRSEVSTRGVVYVHSTPLAVCAHVEWAIPRVRPPRVSLEWTRHSGAWAGPGAECGWTGRPGTAAE